MREKELQVLIHSVQEAKEFVHICEQINGDINISSGKRDADGKSILGILSLDLSLPLQVEIISTEQVDLSVFQKFRLIQ